jgi:hypothetical protein
MDTKDYNTLALCLRELSAIQEVYGMSAKEFQNFSNRSDWMMSPFFQSLDKDLRDNLGFSLGRRIERLIGLAREIRVENRENTKPSFQEKIEKLVHNARGILSNRFIEFGASSMDVRVNCILPSTLEEYNPLGADELRKNGFYFVHKGNDIRWLRGKQVNVCDVHISATPKTVKSVRGHWFLWRTGQEANHVLKAERINGHAFEAQDVRVYRIKCIKVQDNERVIRDAYLCESESLRGQDGHLMFAHGKDTASALSLLKRRIKSETLKRLDI